MKNEPTNLPREAFRNRYTMPLVQLVLLTCVRRQHERLVITHQELAQLLCCSQSTVRRALAEAVGQGWISQTRRHVKDKAWPYRRELPSAYTPGQKLRQPKGGQS